MEQERKWELGAILSNEFKNWVLELFMSTLVLEGCEFDYFLIRNLYENRLLEYTFFHPYPILF